MSALNGCDCRWESKSKNPSALMRAVASHLRKCPLHAEKAKGTGNLPKHGISDMDMDSVVGSSTEPPQKVPRVSTVSGWRSDTCQGLGYLLTKTAAALMISLT